MADGYIEFSTTLDNSDLEKQLKAAEREIDALKAKIEKKESEGNAIEEQMVDAKKAIESTTAMIDKLKKRYQELSQSKDPGDAARREVISAEMDKQYALLEKQYDALDKLDAKWNTVQADLSDYSQRLDEAKGRYALLGQTAQQEASRSKGVFASMSNAISTSMSALVAKVNMAFRRMILFGLILGAINAIRNSIRSLIADNQQFGASVANLRAVLRGYLSSMLSVVMPTLIGIVNTMAAVFGRIASFIDSFFGTNISGAISTQQAAAFSSGGDAGGAKKAAKATNDRAKAAKNLAKAQKEANRQLLSFDELNVLNKDTADDAADAIDDYADDLGDVGGGGIGGGFGGFDPNAGVFQGILDWLDEIRRRIENDVEGPFARIREGLQLIKQGFEELVQGIMTGDWALAWRGLGDIVIGILYVIQGAIWAFLDWLDEVTGGHFSNFFQGLVLLLQGVVDVIEGLLRGNLELTIHGIFEIIDGLVQALGGAVDGVLWLASNAWSFIYQLLSTGIDDLFNHLAEKYPEYAEFFENVKIIAHTALDFIDLLLRGALDTAGQLIHGWLDGIHQFVTGILDILVGIVTLDFERIKQGGREVIDGLFTFFGSTLNIALNTLSDWIDRAKEFFGGLFDYATAGLDQTKEAISGFGGAIDQGLRGAVNAILGAIEWALNGAISGAVDMVNSFIDGANMIPGVWIPTMWAPSISLPRLAGGAVIPPNREFMAVLGDQASGRNLEAPEALIRQIVREESGGMNSQVVALLSQMLAALQARQTIECDGYTLAKVVNQRNMSNAKVYGY